MSSVRTFSSTLGLALLIAGCNPYTNFDGEFYAGDADPENYPIPYRGHIGATAANRFTGGVGTFLETPAFVNGNQVGYFTFPLATPPPADPLLIASGGNPVAANPTPAVYVFDPQATDPFPAVPRCRTPSGYTFDPVNEAFPRSDQYNIFSALPSASYQQGVASSWTYIPVEQEVPITSNGEECQSYKSEKTLLNCSTVAACSLAQAANRPKPTNVSVGQPSGKYLGWAIIDAGAAVFRFNQLRAPAPYSGAPPIGLTGNAPPFDAAATTTYGLNGQKFGFYAHFLVAYIDGGYVPTQQVMTGTPPVAQTRMVVQRVYVPRSGVLTIPTATCGGMLCPQGQVCAGTPPTCQACTAAGATACAAGQTCTGGLCNAPGVVGRGYDVLQGGRGDPNCTMAGPGQQCYSPVCEQWTYAVPGAPQPAAMLPQDETTILGMTPMATTTRFYCLQSK